MKCHKKKFSEKEALTAVKRNGKSRKKYRNETRYYFCRHCNGYHLTHKDFIIKLNNVEGVDLKHRDKWRELM